MKTLKSDIFYAMNEINDKYILEAAQCLEQKNSTPITSKITTAPIKIPILVLD